MRNDLPSSERSERTIYDPINRFAEQPAFISETTVSV
jgi:hypothetical protein